MLFGLSIGARRGWTLGIPVLSGRSTPAVQRSDGTAPATARPGRRTVVRGIRGANSVERDDAEAILAATEELLREIIERNRIEPEDVASALFTVTPDLSAEFPAAAARRLGWTLVPLLNFTEIGVPGKLPRCVRVLVHVNTDRNQDEMVHVYLGEARVLRPDLVSRSSS